MKIDTRFNVNDIVVTINYDKVTALQIESISCIKTKNYLAIRYTLLVSKGISFDSKDVTVVKDENECFKSVQDLADFYKSKS